MGISDCMLDLRIRLWLLRSRRFSALKPENSLSRFSGPSKSQPDRRIRTSERSSTGGARKFGRADVCDLANMIWLTHAGVPLRSSRNGGFR